MSMDKLKPSSPKWSSTLKTVIGLTIAAMILALLITFRNIIGPLLMAFILVYLLHPVAAFLNSHTKLSWRASVTLIYLVLIILVIGLSTLTGLAAIQQIQNLINIIGDFVNNLPKLITELTSHPIYIWRFGPFDFSQTATMSQFSSQVISTLQTLIGRVGTLVGTLAEVTVNTIGWSLFVWVVSYFILADTGKVPKAADFIDIPGYSYDIQRMGSALGRIWNAFLRGQLTIVIMVILSYTILLSILGVRFAFAIAVLAGLARFVPYVGPLVTYIVLGLVTIFQGNYFGLAPIYFTILAIALSILLDQVYDNLVSPRIMGKSLGVHPAAVLVVAIISASLIGLIGLLLAAPMLASVMLVGRYTVRKMFDRDPWSDFREEIEPMGFSWVGKLITSIGGWWKARLLPGLGTQVNKISEWWKTKVSPRLFKKKQGE